jgi:hypothetical protein
MAGSLSLRSSVLDGGFVVAALLLAPRAARRWRFPRRAACGSSLALPSPRSGDVYPHLSA